jgi:hypothetical protein
LDLTAKHQFNVDTSGTGTGKTYTAAAVANALGEPTLVVCPLIVTTAWQRAGAHFGDKFSVINYEKLRTGRTPFGWWDNTPPSDFVREETYKCQCCQREVDFDHFIPCYCHPTGAHCIDIKKKPWKYGKFNFHPGVKFAVFDEVHRCAGDSLNADMLIATKRQGIKTLGLSATLAKSPLDMRAAGYLLDLHSLNVDTLGVRPSFYNWARRNGAAPLPGTRKLKWLVGEEKQLSFMGDIHQQIIPARGVRVRSEDIPGFPEREVSAELYDINEANRVDKLYEQMGDALKMLADRKALDQCPENPMTLMLRARQELELLKVPVAIELARDYLDKGFSVGIFVNFTQTLQEIRARMNGAAFIDGSQTGARGLAQRQGFIDDFQLNRIRLIIVNNEAGGIGVSLHDTRGGFPRVGIVMPGLSAVTMLQVFGRFQRDGGMSKSHYRLIFAAGSCEESTHNNLRMRLNNIDMLNDGDFLPDNLRLSAFAGRGTLLAA